MLAAFGIDDLGWAGSLVSDGGSVVVRDVAADSSGNAYLVGEFSGTVDFDPGAGVNAVPALSGVGGETGFLAAYTAEGGLRWVQAFRGAADARVRVRPMGIAVDGSGRVVVAGSYSAGAGSVEFDPGATLAGSQAFPSLGEDGFVLRAAADGRLQWAVRLEGKESRDRVFDVAVDASGGVCVVGSASGVLDANPDPVAQNLIPNSGGTDAFAIKLSAAGGYEWSAQVAGPGSDQALGVAAGRDGSFAVSGSFERQATIDAAGRLLASAGGLDGFVVRIAAGGVTTWGARIGGLGDDVANGIADGGLLDNGALEQRYIAVGHFTGVAGFSSSGGAAVAAAVQAEGGIDSFVAAVSVAGGLVWSRTLGAAANDAAIGVATDPSGGIVVSGCTEGVVLADGVFSGGADDNPAGAIDGFAVGMRSDGEARWRRYWGGFGVGLLGGAAGVVFDPVQISQDGCLGVACMADGSALVGGAFLAKGRIPAGDGWADLVGSADPARNGFISRIAVPVATDAWVPLAGRTSRVEGWIGDVVVRDVVWNPVTHEEFILGTFRGTVDFDTWPAIESLTSADPNVDEVFVLKRDAVSALKWVRRFTGVGHASAARLATSPAGGVWLAGTFNGVIDFDPGEGVAPLTSAEGSADAFVAKLGADGGYRWAKRIGGVGIDAASDVVADPAGGCIVVGTFTGVADVDPDPDRVDPRLSAGAGDSFVVKMSAAATWARTFGGVGDDTASAVALANAGGIFVAGTFTRSVDFDPGPGRVVETADASVSQDDPDVYVLKLAGDGSFRRVSVLRGPGVDVAGDIAVDESVNVVVTGSFTKAIDVDPGAGRRVLTAGGSCDAFVVKLAAGGLVWSRQIAARPSGAAVGTGEACGTSGIVYAVGTFTGAIDTDPAAADRKSLVSRGKQDVYLVQIQADGTTAAGRSLGLGGADEDIVDGVSSLGISPRVWGAFQGSADFGRRGRPLQLVSPRSPTGRGGRGGFVASYDEAFLR